MAERTIADFVSTASQQFFSRLQINTDFLKEDPSVWEELETFATAKKIVNSLKVVNDTAERAVKLMQDFNGLLTVKEDQKQYVLRCVQEHRRLYPDCKKETLKRKFSN